MMHIIRHEQQDYDDSLREQEALVEAIHAGTAGNTLILTSHPPIYTLGTSAHPEDVLTRSIDGTTIAVHSSGRGGEVTYHGPGQLVCYLIVDLRKKRDLHRHVHQLEQLMIRTLADLGLQAGTSERGIGVWCGSNKIAAIGVRCRRWVCFHGVALNINPNLRHFQGIVPCGMRDQPVTSLSREGVDVSREEVEAIVIHHAREMFAP